MALHEETRSYTKSPTECYQALVALMPQLGFRITRKRDIGWLIQAEQPAGKTRQGAPLNATITCRPGATTQVTVACEMRVNDSDGEEKAAVESLFEALDRRLN